MSEAPAPAPTPSPAPAPAPAPAAFDWKGAGLGDSELALVNERQWKDPASLLTSYVNLEKVRGVPAERLVTLPVGDKPEEWAPIYDKLGRPKAPGDYGIPVPQGGNPEHVNAMASWFHEAGLNGKQARTIAERNTAFIAAETKKQQEAVAARDAEQVGKLKAAWGAQYDLNAKVVDAAAKSFGMSSEQLAALKQVMGPEGAMKFMHSIGSKLGVEGEFITPEQRATMAFGTPEGAKQRIEQLKADSAFAKRFAAGDREARDEMKKLHKAAYPDDYVL